MARSLQVIPTLGPGACSPYVHEHSGREDYKLSNSKKSTSKT